MIRLSIKFTDLQNYWEEVRLKMGGWGDRAFPAWRNRNRSKIRLHGSSKEAHCVPTHINYDQSKHRLYNASTSKFAVPGNPSINADGLVKTLDHGSGPFRCFSTENCTGKILAAQLGNSWRRHNSCGGSEKLDDFERHRGTNECAMGGKKSTLAIQPNQSTVPSECAAQCSAHSGVSAIGRRQGGYCRRAMPQVMRQAAKGKPLRSLWGHVVMLSRPSSIRQEKPCVSGSSRIQSQERTTHVKHEGEEAGLSALEDASCEQMGCHISQQICERTDIDCSPISEASRARMESPSLRKERGQGGVVNCSQTGVYRAETSSHASCQLRETGKVGKGLLGHIAKACECGRVETNQTTGNTNTEQLASVCPASSSVEKGPVCSESGEGGDVSKNYAIPEEVNGSVDVCRPVQDSSGLPRRKAYGLGGSAGDISSSVDGEVVKNGHAKDNSNASSNNDGSFVGGIISRCDVEPASESCTCVQNVKDLQGESFWATVNSKDGRTQKNTRQHPGPPTETPASVANNVENCCDSRFVSPAEEYFNTIRKIRKSLRECVLNALSKRRTPVRFGLKQSGGCILSKRRINNGDHQRNEFLATSLMNEEIRR